MKGLLSCCYGWRSSQLLLMFTLVFWRTITLFLFINCTHCLYILYWLILNNLIHFTLHFVVTFKYLLASNLDNVQFARKMFVDWERQYGPYFPSGRVASSILLFLVMTSLFLRCSHYVWHSLSDVLHLSLIHI